MHLKRIEAANAGSVDLHAEMSIDHGKSENAA